MENLRRKLVLTKLVRKISAKLNANIESFSSKTFNLRAFEFHPGESRKKI
jgi:hypothetical protein